VHTIIGGDSINKPGGLAFKYCGADFGTDYQALRALNDARKNEPNAIGPITDSYNAGKLLMKKKQTANVSVLCKTSLTQTQ
jgi:hypothetical protein